jgi:hypothetical protein
MFLPHLMAAADARARVKALRAVAGRLYCSSFRLAHIFLTDGPSMKTYWVTRAKQPRDRPAFRTEANKFINFVVKHKLIIITSKRAVVKRRLFWALFAGNGAAFPIAVGITKSDRLKNDRPGLGKIPR